MSLQGHADRVLLISLVQAFPAGQSITLGVRTWGQIRAALVRTLDLPQEVLLNEVGVSDGQDAALQGMGRSTGEPAGAGD